MFTAFSEKLRKFTAVTLITSLVFSFTAPVFAATGGPNNAATGANITGIGNTSWTNPTRIVTDNSSFATAVLSDATKISNYLRGTGYGFSIPAGATINGIQVTIDRSSSSVFGNERIQDNEVRLVKAGSIVGNNKAVLGTNWPASSTALTYGGTSDLWGTTWTPADINDANFGAVLSVLNATGFGQSYTASVDYIQITVTYTVPPADVTPPTFTLTTLSSNNAVPTSAKSGDVVTAVFTTSETLVANPTVTFGGQAMTFGTLVGSTYTYTRTLTGTETVGSAALLVTGSDLIPNTTTNSNIGTLTTDFTAPASPSIVSPAANSFLTTAALDKIDWTDVTDSSAPVTYVYSSSSASTTNPDGTFVTPLYTSGALSTSEISTAGTPAGVYYVSVKAVDAVGNSSPWTTPIQITVDNTAPVITINPYNTLPTNTDVVVTASANEGTLNSTTNTFTANGSFIFTATDAAGNVSNSTVTITNIDKDAPVISLLGSAPMSVYFNDPYVEPGATCTDTNTCSVTYDNSAVNTSAIASYSVFYDASDSVGNISLQVVRTVNVIDNVQPIITLLGNQTLTIAQNSTYTDAGATALDNAYGDITASIVVTGSVDTSTVGVYTLTYNVTDASLNVADPVTRVVTVTDQTAPVISETTAIPTPSTNHTPSYTFTTDEAGTISYAGGCTSTDTTADIGTNTIVFDTLADGAYATCTITVTDLSPALNVSNILPVTSFTIDSTGPAISAIASSITFPPGANITWTTNEPSTTYVEYGITAAYGSSTTLDSTLTTSHTANISGLEQVTEYHFRVVSVDALGNTTVSSDNTFTTSGIGGGGGGPAGPIIVLANPAPTFTPTTPAPTTPTTPTNPTPTSETNPTTPESTPTPNPENPTTPEETNNTTGDNSELIPTSFPNDTESNTGGTTGTTTGGTTGGTTTGGGGTGTTTGGTFNPADANLDAGGGVTPEETETEETVQLAPTEIPQDIGGGVTPEEESHTLAWTLLGLVVLLNLAWFYTRKNSQFTR